jgi:hypothetical protein
MSLLVKGKLNVTEGFNFFVVAGNAWKGHAIHA